MPGAESKWQPHLRHVHFIAIGHRFSEFPSMSRPLKRRLRVGRLQHSHDAISGPRFSEFQPKDCRKQVVPSPVNGPRRTRPRGGNDSRNCSRPEAQERENGTTLSGLRRMPKSVALAPRPNLAGNLRRTTESVAAPGSRSSIRTHSEGQGFSEFPGTILRTAQFAENCLRG